MNNIESPILQNIISSAIKVGRAHREILNGRLSRVFWFTGLPCSGKTTLAIELEKKLCLMDYKTYILDGDIVRNGICNDLGYTDIDRFENLRRVSEITKLFLDAGINVISAFISPLEKDRKLIQTIIGQSNIIEIFCNCPLSICEKRDVKGMYKKARLGEIKNFTGITSTYENPKKSDIVLNTEIQSVDECIKQILNFIQKNYSTILEIK